MTLLEIWNFLWCLFFLEWSTKVSFFQYWSFLNVMKVHPISWTIAGIRFLFLMKKYKLKLIWKGIFCAFFIIEKVSATIVKSLISDAMDAANILHE